MERVVALTIAGSDSGGGAGIQADLKTFAAHGVYGTCAIAAVTAQNSVAVTAIHPVPPAVLTEQVRAVWDDFRPRAVKIGMLGGPDAVRAVADELARCNGAERAVPVVLDPVMVAKAGARLLDADALDALRSLAQRCATLVTPNVPEAEALLGRALDDGPEAAARALRALLGCDVLLKGGHAVDAGDRCVDHLATAAGVRAFDGPRISSRNLHGTGCTLSSAIAAGLALGWPLEDAVARAKRYVVGAIASGAALGRGVGVLDHMWPLRPVPKLEE